MAPKQKLTKRIVDTLQPAQNDYVLRDTEIPGFGVKITPKGRKVYFLYYRTAAGRERRPSIGKHGEVTCEQARKIASTWLADVKKGGDPSGERKTKRKVETLKEFAGRYARDYSPKRKRPGTLKTDETNLRCHILPELGNLKVDEIDHSDVDRMHRSSSDTPGAANRSLDLLSHMMNVAEREGLRPINSNPCRYIERYKLKKRQRFLSAKELAHIANALAEAERDSTELPGVIALIRLLLFTGARLSEIKLLKWDFVDFDGKCLRLPESKTGPKTIYLPAPALEILNGLSRQDGNPYVIVGAKPGTHLVNIQKPWRRIRRRAGLDDVRLHDLRHSFASVGVAGGLSLPIIGELLGHSKPSTTAIYAHLANDPVKQAAEEIGKRIKDAMNQCAASNNDKIHVDRQTIV